ncbi:MAG: LTA synthase family protein [Clostridiales bacterium]|nr:LTA synthase family protein [Clostridiales bacterium]
MDKRKRKHLGIRKFFKGKSGKRFLVFLEILLVGAFLVQPDLYYDATAETFLKRFYADSISICGGLWIILVFLTIKDFHIRPKMNKMISWITAVITPAVAFLWLESYDHMQFWAPLNQIPGWYLFLDLVIYYVIYLFLLLICNSIRGASIAMIIVTAFFGILNYELTLFRGMSIIASDIYSILTAVSVANTYRIQIDVDTAEYFMLALVLVALLLKLERFRLFRWKGRIVFAAAYIAIFMGFCQVYVYSDYLEDIGVDFRVYRPQYKYRYYGTLLTTIRTFGYLHVTVPEGYSVEAVQEIIAEFEESQQTAAAQDSTGSTENAENTTGDIATTTDDASGSAANTSATTESPNIIVVMNESFADLQVLGDLEVTKDYMPFYRKLTENTIKGYTYSSVFGGNTANSEFEFLTGNTMAFLPDNSVPYQLFLRTTTAGLTYTLKNQGYSPAYALHPYYRTGYSRYKIYPLMGFDYFYTSDDFSVFTDTVNYHITDYEDYKKIIELYEDSQEDDSPFYLFNVTMQNHGSYTGSTLETGDTVQLEGEYQYYRKVEQYLNMIKMSDKALKYLVHYFEKVEEPTVIVFFGDHQPDLDEEFYNQLLGTSIDQLEGEDQQQLYKVPFLIWANYDIEEQTVERTSNNYLVTYLAEIAGIETTGYIDYLTQLREKIPAINAIGYWGDDGNFYENDDESSPYYELIHDYNLLEYNNLFGKEDQQTSFFYVSDDE